jgi:hypothetical protein
MPEQLPVDPTIWWTGKTNPETGRKILRFKHTLPNGKPRLRHPETNKPLLTTGDIIIGKMGCLKLQWNGQWIPIPTIEEFMEWTLDSVCPTPDGDIVEPDAPNSWLSLVGLV